MSKLCLVFFICFVLIGLVCSQRTPINANGPRNRPGNNRERGNSEKNRNDGNKNPNKNKEKVEEESEEEQKTIYDAKEEDKEVPIIQKQEPQDNLSTIHKEQQQNIEDEKQGYRKKQKMLFQLIFLLVLALVLILIISLMKMCKRPQKHFVQELQHPAQQPAPAEPKPHDSPVVSKACVQSIEIIKEKYLMNITSMTHLAEEELNVEGESTPTFKFYTFRNNF